MVRPSETVDTSVLTPAIRIDACIESHVRTVVVIDDAARFVFEKNRLDRWILRIVPFRSMIGRFVESIGWIACGPATSNLFGAHRRIIIPNHDAGGTSLGTGAGFSPAWVGLRDEWKF